MVDLELLTESDIDYILEWNKGRSADYLFQWAGRGYVFPLTREQILNKIRQMNNSVEPKQIVFKILDSSCRKMIGTVELSDIDRIKNTYVSRFLIGEKVNRNKGYGAEALKKVILYAYSRLERKILFLRVLDFNKNAIRCYEKVGFRKIKFVKHVRKTGDKTWNAYVMKIKLTYR